MAWTLTAAVGLFVLVRLLGVTDHRARLFALATLTMWFLVPALIALVTAAALRARALVAVTVALLAVLLVWVAPDLRWWSTAAAIEGPTWVVAATNIGPDHRDVRATAEDVMAIRADVVNVVELTGPSRDALHDAGIADRYPYFVEDPRPNAHGSAIYSRYPIRDSGVLKVGGVHMAHATVELPSGPATVIAVHTTQPLAGPEALEAELAQLRSIVEDIDGPVILAGDFNASRQHQPFRALLEAGFTDAHEATGRGWTATWPVGGPLPPFALLDHVLVSPDLSVATIDEVPVSFSDHRAVVAEIGRAAP